jgi:hypothetical protein
MNLNTIASTNDFFSKLMPEPKDKNIRTQLGCHLEEIAEMLREIAGKDGGETMLLTVLSQSIEQAGTYFKGSDGPLIIKDRVEFLDGLCDQIVTATGIGNYLKMDVPGGLAEVNRSNFSKFGENGLPILDENKKMVKGPNYSKPDLKIFV